MGNSFKLPHAVAHILLGDDSEDVFTADQMQAYASEAQTDLIGRLAQMQEHEAIEWLLKARQEWWKS